MNRIATIGFFDGVHAGHRYLFERMGALASARGLAPLIVTFDEHPRAVLQREFVPQLLTTLAERKDLLSAYGEVLVLSFREVHSLTAVQFMTLLHSRYQVTTLLMGYDHRFGSDRLQASSEYRLIGAQTGVEVVTMDEYTDGAKHVSSTEIRQALLHGDLIAANALLGRAYSLSGRVVHGKGIGRTLGFPTANIAPESPEKIIPKAGVYAVRVKSTTVQDAPAFLNIDTKGIIEAHIPSFEGDLYGATMEITFLRYLRAEKQFDSLEALRAQIARDINALEVAP